MSIFGLILVIVAALIGLFVGFSTWVEEDSFLLAVLAAAGTFVIVVLLVALCNALIFPESMS